MISEAKPRKTDRRPWDVLGRFITNAPMAAAMFDRDLCYLAASRGWKEAYNLKDDIIGLYYYDIFPQIPEHWKEIHRRCLAGNVETSEGEPFNKPDGTTIWLKWVVCPWYNEMGEIGGIIIFSENITSRKLAEKMLSDSQEKFRQLVETTSDWIWEVDRNGVYTYVSPKITSLLGYLPEEVIGKSPFDLMPSDEAKSVSKLFEAFAIKGKPFFNLENINLHKNGQQIVMETSGVPIFDESGNLTGYRGIDRDITERKQAEEEYRALLATTHDGFWMVDVYGRILEVNDAYCTLTGYSRAELLTMKISDIETAHDSSEIERNINKVRQTGFDRFEGHHRCKDGRIIHIEISVQYAEIGGGRFYAFIRDITERKRAEEALRESEERFKLLADNAPSDIYLCKYDANWTALYVNKYIETLTGYSRDQFLNGDIHFGEIIHPGDSDMVASVIKNALDAGQPFHTVYRIIHADGSVRWVEENGDAIRKDDKIKFIVGIVNDITDRKKAEAEIKELSERQQSILMTVPDIIMQVDADKIYTWANEAGLKFFGDDVIGKEANDFFEGEQTTYEKVEPLFQGDENVIYVESWQRRRDRAVRLLAWWCRVIKDDSGNIIGALSTARDITERKKSERKLKEWHELMQYIIHHDPNAIAVLDKDLKHIFVSKRFLDDYRVKEKNIIGKHHYDVFPDIPEKWRDVHRRALAGEIISGEDDIFVREDGTIDNTRWECRPWYHADGSIGGIILYTEVITKRKQTEAMIRESEERYRTLFSTMAQGVVYQSADGKIIRANPAAERILGLSLDQIQGRTSIDPRWCSIMEGGSPFPGDQHPSMVALRTGEPVHGVTMGVFNPSTESYNWILIDAIPLSEHGEPVVYTTFTDITGQKQIETALRQNKERYRTLVEALDVALCRWLPDTTLTYTNEQYRRIFGIKTETTTQKWVNFLPESIREETVSFYDNLTRNPRTESYEHAVTLADGTQRFYQWIDTPIIDNKGKVVEFQSVGIDITDRKESEQQIVEQAALLDVTQDAILVHDFDDRILYWNKGAEKIYGWKKEDTIGKNIRKLLFKKDTKEIAEAEKAVMKEGVWRGEFTHITRDGKDIAIESHWSLILDEKGEPKANLVVNTDVTEKKNLEQQILRTQRLESIGTLAGGIAHDLNNIFAPILLAAESIRKKLPDEESLRILSMIESSAQRGSDLIMQVLSFARGVEGERTLIQIHQIVDEIGKIMKETFPKSISLHANVPDDLPMISADATQIHQVLINVCVNARDAMPLGGVIEIFAESLILDEQYVRMHIDAKPGHYIHITVADQGVGMPPSIVERIFEPFFTTKEIGKGTGLGLSTVHTIVKSHGGFISVYSEVGKGTTFRIYLPTQEGVHIASTAQKTEIIPGNGELILVVDDEDNIREITKTTLETYGYSVITAADGTEAVAMYAARVKEIAVVLTDMVMPHMDGAATIRALHKMNPKVKCISVSGLIQNVHNLPQETVVFLHKPYTSEILLKTIHEMINRK
jgi:PAS domain S-box-containing protein